ncbi:MAG TPA: N-acetylglucosamine-6-phosphate deacetylase [Bacillota bacterium]|nr:N-acetylglucosamine-6-phosphate deacetylase [Bacillota bacterium]
MMHGSNQNVKIIKNAKIPSASRITRDDDVLIEDGIIQYIGRLGEDLPKDAEIIDASGLYLIPGFIDCHTHGFNGHRADDGPDSLKHMAVEYARRGITGFYATVEPEDHEEYAKIFENYRKAFNTQYKGAHFLGIHAEGPFLNPEKKGAINESKMILPTTDEVQLLIDQGSDLLRIITLAPERDGACEAASKFSKAGIVVSMGHTMATYQQAWAATQAGVTHATHMFNAMRPFDHREPGVIGASVLNDSVYCELIADGIHVSLEAMEMLIRLKGTDRIIAVSDSDSMSGSGVCGREMEDYFIRDGGIYLKDGTLSGSTRDLSDHFRTFITQLGVGIPDAVKMTSTNCAEHMRINKGRVKEGFDADLNLVDDSFKIRYTFVSGEVL